MTAGPVTVEFVGDVAMLCRDAGRTTDVRVLTRELSRALAERGADARSGGFLGSLWHVVDGVEDLLTAARLRRTNALH